MTSSQRQGDFSKLEQKSVSQCKNAKIGTIPQWNSAESLKTHHENIE